jgi:hypothetical protein
MFSEEFENAKFEVKAFFGILYDKTKTPEQVKRAHLGVTSVLLRASGAVYHRDDLISQSEYYQIGILRAMADEAYLLHHLGIER